MHQAYSLDDQWKASGGIKGSTYVATKVRLRLLPPLWCRVAGPPQAAAASVVPRGATSVPCHVAACSCCRLASARPAIAIL